MELRAAVARLCPVGRTPAADGEAAIPGDLTLNPSVGGASIQVHEELMRARCPKLFETNGAGEVDVPEDGQLLSALVRWIYCEAVDLSRCQAKDAGTRLLRLATTLGLRDCDVLRERLAGSWRRGRKDGTLAEDLLGSYEDGSGGLCFLAACDGGREEPLMAGWRTLLQLRSSYFSAMLSGNWAESRADSSDPRPIRIGYPRARLRKLLRFLHGAAFVTCMADIHDAVECGAFFGVPSLMAHANDWIVANLTLENAPVLWCYLEDEPQLAISEADEEQFTLHANEACFNFHLKHFEELSADPEGGDGSWVPLHDIAFSQMERLLGSGLVDMPKEELSSVVERFVEAKCGARCGREYEGLLQRLRPPRVLFNRELRGMLLCEIEPSIRAVL